MRFSAVAPAGRLTIGGLLCVALSILTGCANVSDVSSTGHDNYTVTATGISYTMSMPALNAAALAKADAHCATQERDMQVRQQARGWRPMEVELDFRCVPRQLNQPVTAVH